MSTEFKLLEQRTEADISSGRIAITGGRTESDVSTKVITSIHIANRSAVNSVRFALFVSATNGGALTAGYIIHNEESSHYGIRILPGQTATINVCLPLNNTDEIYDTLYVYVYPSYEEGETPEQLVSVAVFGFEHDATADKQFGIFKMRVVHNTTAGYGYPPSWDELRSTLVHDGEVDEEWHITHLTLVTNVTPTHEPLTTKPFGLQVALFNNEDAFDNDYDESGSKQTLLLFGGDANNGAHGYDSENLRSYQYDSIMLEQPLVMTQGQGLVTTLATPLPSPSTDIAYVYIMASGYVRRIAMGTSYKLLAQLLAASGADWTTLYTVPTDKETIVSNLHLCNLISAADAFSVRITKSGESAGDKGIMFSGADIEASDVMPLQIGITLSAGDVIEVKQASGSGQVAFNLFGAERDAE